jgi:hypothetical protein
MKSIVNLRGFMPQQYNFDAARQVVLHVITFIQLNHDLKVKKMQKNDSPRRSDIYRLAGGDGDGKWGETRKNSGLDWKGGESRSRTPCSAGTL